ncbi:MAG: hypothetical protein ACLQSR_04760 [Limisphaerales bacterium]
MVLLGGVYFLTRREKVRLKAALKALNTNASYLELTEKKRKSDDEIELENQKWETFKPQIAKFLREKGEFRELTDPLQGTSNIRTLISACVELQIKDSIQDIQTFLPPTLRLPVSHYVRFLFTEDDVQYFQKEQKIVGRTLEEELTADYDNKTVAFKNPVDASTTEILRDFAKALKDASESQDAATNGKPSGWTPKEKSRRCPAAN